MFFEKGKIKLYYEKKGEGAPLIMLHGNGESHEIFDEATEVLKRKFTVYAIDSRGHGKRSKHPGAATAAGIKKENDHGKDLCNRN